MEDNAQQTAAPEENIQEMTGKKEMTKENKVAVFLLAIAAIVWVFVPFYKTYYYHVTASEMLFGPIFRSWDVFTEAFFGSLSYGEYLELMSQTREFWIAVVAGSCILLGIFARLRNKENLAFACSVAGILAFLEPMLEVAYHMVVNSTKIPAYLWREFWSVFGWGYWTIAVIFVIVMIVNRKKTKSE